MSPEKKYIIVANWKMYLNFYESITLCTVNQSSIIEIAKTHTLIFLPSFVALNSVANALKDTGALYGAQDCSEFDRGAYTGDVSASMLAQLGCSYSLIGHCERRIFHNETDEQIAAKFQQLLKYNIIPILCVGEQEQSENRRDVYRIIKQQLHVLKSISVDIQFFIAYEPGWVIGKNGVICDKQYIDQVKSVIRYIAFHMNSFKRVKILYGGSVTHQTIRALLELNDIDGFLIGKAGASFSEFQSIINVL